ncbi:MAG TPA: A24 family peptidase [Candidatus Elarobacter sp.]|jgi:leader peptidase (prepilin peptidase)/N-methyltransferase|nr:A24 family peptidase [Candidatus Elarobacter sp.]
MITPAAVASLCGALLAGSVDARTGRIPDRLTRPTAAAALTVAAATGSAVAAWWGALAAGGSLLLLYAATRGRGLGFGDVKLATAIGIGFGPSLGLIALGAAFVIGGAYASWLLAVRRAGRHDAVPFGPFLAAGTLIAAMISSALPA